MVDFLNPRHGLSVGTHNFSIDLDGPGFHMRVDLFTIAASERYLALWPIYMQGASGAFIVYKTARDHRCDHLAEWLGRVRDYREPDFVVAVIANVDDGDSPDVWEEGEAFARDNSLLFFTICTRAGKGIYEALSHTMREVYSRKYGMPVA
jgi:GTPase SAR1 family protein